MPDMSLRPGDVFAGYIIERELGSGGMGSVYLARHPRLPRMDALKLLRPELCSDQSFVMRFEREADMVARLDHPNIVSVHDRGSQDGQLWISMRFIDGTNAEQALRSEPAGMSPERVVRIIGKVASALDYAHRHGLLHRDVKPANILLTPGAEDEDELERVFLSDFGVAKAIGEASDSMSSLTSTGSVVATLDYASPEQIKGQALDHRSDIYALGCVLYKLLTGDVPYPAESVVARVYGHLNKDIPRPTEAVPSLPSGFDDVIAMAMAKERGQRYQTCRAMAVAARAALTTAPAAPAAPAAPGAADASDDSLPTTAYLLPAAAPRAHPGTPSASGRDATSAATQANPGASASSVDGMATVASAQARPGVGSPPAPGSEASWAPNPQSPDPAAQGRPPDGGGSEDSRARDPRLASGPQPGPEASRGAPAAQPQVPRRTLEQPAFPGPPPGGGYDGARGYSGARDPAGPPPGPTGPPPGPTGLPPDPSPGSPRRWPVITAIVATVLIIAALGTWFVLRDGTSSTASLGTGTTTAATTVPSSAASSAVNSSASGSPSASPSPSPSSASASSSSAVGTPPAGPVAGLPHATPLPENLLVVGRVVDNVAALYLLDAASGTSGQQLTAGVPGSLSPLLSADRGTLIYVHSGTAEANTLRTVAVDGSGDRQLFDALPSGCKQLARPAWNPIDQTELALPCTTAQGEVRLHRTKVDGTDEGTITTGFTVVDDVTYSPDGSTLAFWASEKAGSSGGTIYLQPADGSAPAHQLAGTPEGAKDVDPGFSPDGSSIAFSRVQSAGDGVSASTRVYQVNVDGSNLRAVTPPSAYGDINPCYSPDGTELAFKSNRPSAAGADGHQIWTIGLDGTGLKQLAGDAPGPVTASPAWIRR